MNSRLRTFPPGRCAGWLLLLLLALTAWRDGESGRCAAEEVPPGLALPSDLLTGPEFPKPDATQPPAQEVPNPTSERPVPSGETVAPLPIPPLEPPVAPQSPQLPNQPNQLTGTPSDPVEPPTAPVSPATPGMAPADAPVVPLDPAQPSAPGTLTLSLLDAQDQPAVARIRIVSKDGVSVDALPGLIWFWGGPLWQNEVPAGKYNLEIVRGPRVQGWIGGVVVLGGQSVTQTVTLDDYQPVWRANWYWSDPFIRVDGIAGNGFFYENERRLSAAVQGEGLVAAGVTKWASASDEGPLLVMAQEYALDGAGRYVGLYPQASAAVVADKNEELFETLSRVRDTGALILAAHPAGLDEIGTGAARLLPFLLAGGDLVDVVDLGEGGRQIELWHMLLNRGLRLPAVAGGPDGAQGPEIPKGGTYVRLPSARSGTNEYFTSLRRGRLVAGNGPFVRLQIAGADAGDVIPPSSTPRMTEIYALASSDPHDSVKRVDIIYNGRVAETFRGSLAQKEMVITASIRFEDAGWVQARYYSENKGLWAVTNPVYIALAETAPAARLANVNLSVWDESTFAPLAARVTVRNLGVTVRRFRLTGGSAVLPLPPAARLTVEAEGYEIREISLFREGGFARVLSDEDGAVGVASMSRAYDLLETMMQDLRLRIGMKRLSAAEPVTDTSVRPDVRNVPLKENVP